jgi:tetratricopeptide (TPR) repeat protein
LTYTLAGGGAWTGSVRESYKTEKSLAQKAIAMDGTLPEGHVALADVMRIYEWDWSGAEDEYKQSTRFNPSSAQAHAEYSEMLSILGRHEEALREARLAQQSDPVSPLMSSRVGYAFYWARRYDEAIEQFRKTLDLDPNHCYAYYGLGRTYLEKGMGREALLTLEKGNSLAFAGRRPDGKLGYAYGALNQRAKALKIADQLRILQRQGDPDAAFDLAHVYAGLGDKDRALEFLQRAYEEHYPSMEVLKVEPHFDSLRSDPRFQDLLRRMNLPP